MSNRVNADIDGLTIALNQIGERAMRGIHAVMKEEGESIAKLAREFAPVDEGNLEDAIRVRDEVGGRNALGRFERAHVVVDVDESRAAPHYNKDGSVTKGTESKVVGDYAQIMHEHLLPYGTGFGDMNLGPKSRSKDGGRGVVGGKFLERALALRLRPMMQAVAAIARRAIR